MGTRGLMQVHGEVSRAPARWVAVAVPQDTLQDVVYEKAAGEQIAKVRLAALPNPLSGWLRKPPAPSAQDALFDALTLEWAPLRLTAALHGPLASPHLTAAMPSNPELP